MSGGVVRVGVVKGVGVGGCRVQKGAGEWMFYEALNIYFLYISIHRVY